MSGLLNPDTIATVAAVALAIGCALLTHYTEPGGLLRAPIVVLATRTVRGLGYHAAHKGRHVRRDAAPLSALETAPDPVSPFAARTA